MSDAYFVDIVDATIAALNDDPPTGVPAATKRRAVPGEQIKSARIGVFLGDETLDPPRANSRLDPLARRRIQLAVQCTGVAGDVTALDETVAPLLAHVTARLGMTDLDARVHYLREVGTTRQAILDLDRFVIHATVVFECSYQTRRNNLAEKY